MNRKDVLVARMRVLSDWSPQSKIPNTQRELGITIWSTQTDISTDIPHPDTRVVSPLSRVTAASAVTGCSWPRSTPTGSIAIGREKRESAEQRYSFPASFLPEGAAGDHLALRQCSAHHARRKLTRDVRSRAALIEVVSISKAHCRTGVLGELIASLRRGCRLIPDVMLR